MQTIIQAAREVIKTCRKTFSDMRWNCSSIELAPNYLLDLERGKQHCWLSRGHEWVESASVRVCVLGLGKVLLLGGNKEGVHSLVVLFSETMSIVIVPVMLESETWSPTARHQSGLLISLEMHLLTALKLLLRACRLAKQHTLGEQQLSWGRASLHACDEVLRPPINFSQLQACHLHDLQTSSIQHRGKREVYRRASLHDPRVGDSTMSKLCKSICLLALLGCCLVLKSSLRRCSPSWWFHGRSQLQWTGVFAALWVTDHVGFFFGNV